MHEKVFSFHIQKNHHVATKTCYHICAMQAATLGATITIYLTKCAILSKVLHCLVYFSIKTYSPEVKIK